MFKLSKPKVLFLVSALLVAIGLFHIFVRQSAAFAAAVSDYSAQHHVAPGQISLCFFCRKQLSGGNGVSHYRFTLVVDRDGGSQKVVTHSQSIPGTDRYAVSFE